MSREDARAATRAYWAQQSKYRTKEERWENFQQIGNFVSSHILFDERVDHKSARVYNRPHAASQVDDSIKTAFNAMTLDKRRKKFPINGAAHSDLSSMGHSAASAERARKLNLHAHHADY